MQRKIVQRALPENYKSLPDIPEFLSKIYAARGVVSADELSLQLKSMASAAKLKGLDTAVALLVDVLSANGRIVIVGDFDADGATSTTIAYEALREFGANNVDYLVPDRFKFGYGLTPEIVDLAAQSNPTLIVTVDNGISSHEGVARAHALGIKVIVTDHHLPGDELPDADAIVNPAQYGCNFPSKNMAGVGVIFYVMSALRASLRTINWFQDKNLVEPNMAAYLDLVALGTVADLVALDFYNRILVEQGMRRIRAGKARPGILALFEVAGRNYETAVTSDLGFAVGPRLNAAGRLDDMSTGIECLLSRDMLDARQRAQVLNGLNQERKHIEEDMRRDADAAFSQINIDQPPKAFVLYEEHWHQGVIGILASRVKEKFHRPVVAFAPESDDPDQINILKGSARSIPGLHMRDALDVVAKKYPDVLVKFGGHAMAAGMSIEVAKLSVFESAFQDVVESLLGEEDLEAIIYTDGELDPAALTISNVEQIERAGPWGQKFPEPCFDAQVRVVQKRVLKEKHLKLVVEFEGGELFDAIQFSSPYCSEDLTNIRLVFRPSINEFRGRRSVQLMIDYIEPVD
ncbi:single-stranded-DNA-specific exonuclease RecJ [Oleiphilus sp. HI0009]|nr:MULTISPECIES: single-stranded-DNA-specific exonuclease RecJ [unclassified Oleiphilus]KZX78029.1 single-stranded-DNA-specific exonuclease RecJ [Oleiphilus sp. HI0009]KZY66164.1 single-stranded-DNA-specific exonuclease RecJ [Oleiphilus sp. HI0066]KZY68612.1 single-stranded-DNA-specific exonuclease RecJ [Oleiphilus sp. HI0067]MCH2159312.1 single-stranded-DNA-specific exonuclease RecJ [Oleiphilaceae bacterium]